MSEYICPHCKNPIYDDDALLCLYCGESLRRSTGFIGRLKYSHFKLVVVLVVLIISLAFLFLVIW